MPVINRYIWLIKDLRVFKMNCNLHGANPLRAILAATAWYYGEATAESSYDDHFAKASGEPSPPARPVVRPFHETSTQHTCLVSK